MTPTASRPSRWTRRRFLGAGLTATAAVLVGGYELVDHGELPGRYTLDRLDGACSVSTPPERFRTAGPTLTGRFASKARGREVGYTIAYPPGHRPGDQLPLGLFLHPHGGDHTSRLGRLTLAQALAGTSIAPLALAAFDGGDLYWNAHPGDDPLAMIVDEIIPMCRRRGLGTGTRSIAAIGISMGAYGTILLAERHPELIVAAAAISPAIWTSYGQARNVDGNAFATANDFADDDVIAHAGALALTPLRVASGGDDPFHPGVVAFVHRLGPEATIDLTSGCHDIDFFAAQQQPSLRFIADHLTA